MTVNPEKADLDLPGRSSKNDRRVVSEYLAITARSTNQCKQLINSCHSRLKQ